MRKLLRELKEKLFKSKQRKLAWEEFMEAEFEITQSLPLELVMLREKMRAANF